MTTRPRSLARLLSVGLLFLVPARALAGPNEGGTLILHANPGLVFTSDIQNYCGMSALDSCSAAVTSVPWDPGRKIVFHAIAAFPPESQPRLKALSFGIDYDPTKFVMVARGTCADFEIPGIDWLAPGAGTSQSWTTGAQTGLLAEVYWFAGYAYSEQTLDSTSVSLIPHPVQHGVFVDDAFPAEVDTVAGYGGLGFGTAGALPCPAVPSTPPEDGGDGPETDDPPAQPQERATLSLEVTLGSRCSLVVECNADSATYGPGDRVVLDIRNGIASVNGRTFFPLPPPSRRLIPVRSIRLNYGEIPAVRNYIRTHSGDSLEVWNAARNEYIGNISRITGRCFSTFRLLSAAGSDHDGVITTIKEELLRSPLVASVDVVASHPGARRAALDVCFTGSPPQHERLEFSMDPPPPPTAMGHTRPCR